MGAQQFGPGDSVTWGAIVPGDPRYDTARETALDDEMDAVTHHAKAAKAAHTAGVTCAGRQRQALYNLIDAARRAAELLS